MARFEVELEDAFGAAMANVPGQMATEQAKAEVMAEALVYPMHPGMHRAPREIEPQEQPDELDAMEEDDLLAIVRRELDRSACGVDEDLAGNWQLAMDYYYGATSSDAGSGCIDEETGMATVESLDVADMIEAQLAQTMPVYEGDAIFRFGAQGQNDQEIKQDEQRAEDESEVCNYVLMSQNNGYIGIQSVSRDSLLFGMGVMKVATEEQTTVESTKYEGLDQTELAMLSSEPNVRVMQQGDNIVVNRYTQARRVVVEPVPPEEMQFTESWRSPFLDGIPFVAHSRIVRRSDLIEMGYDQETVDQIPTESGDLSNVSLSRSITTNESEYLDDIPGNEPVRLSECYIRIDYDGDGLSEQRKVMIGGESTLLDNVPVAEQPFALFVPILRPHRMVGLSLFDRLRAVQDSKTEALQQHIDNMRWCNMPDVDIVSSQVNEADVLSRRPGGVNRMTSPGAIQRNAPVPIGNDALQLMDYLDKVRSERGGASLDLQSAQMQVQGDSAHGVERQVSSKELMATFLASTMAQTGIVPMVRKIHAELRRSGGGPITARSVGSSRPISSDPAQWPAREEVYLINAVTLGDQMRRQQALQGIMMQQQQLMQQGHNGVLTDLAGVHHAMIDSAKNAKLTNPEQYFVDPASPQAQQAMQQAQQAQQQQQQMQQQQMQMQNQLLLQLEQIRADAAMQREQIKFMSDRMKTQEDARQADQSTMVDLTEAELKYRQNVPGSNV